MSNIAVGKEYVSRHGNCLKIFEREERKDKPGEFYYKGLLTEVMEDHKSIKGKTHVFFEDGKWVAFPGGIHDLVKEREKA